MSDRIEANTEAKGLSQEGDFDWSKHLETVSKSSELTNQNLVQQNTITYQQALSQIAISGISKCFELMSHVDPVDDKGQKRIETYRDMIDQLNEMVQTAALVAVRTVNLPDDP